MSILSLKATATIVLRDLRSAGGSLTRAEVEHNLETLGIPRDRATRAIRQLINESGQVVQITRDDTATLIIPTRYRDSDAA